MKCLTVALLLALSTPLFAQPYPVVNSATKRFDERADALLMANKADSAVALYNTWLVANPRDYTAWYNLACALAKSGRPQEASQALQNAARTGFRQADAAKEDEDLKTIRKDPGFAEATRLMDSVKQADVLPDMVRRLLPSRSIGTYVALLPPDYNTSYAKPYTFCVVLQGSSGNEIEFARMAQEFGREGIIYIVPRAPYPNYAATAQYGSNRYTAYFPDAVSTWSDLDTISEGYIQFIADCIADARQHFRITAGPGLLIGQSQGATYADLFALHHPELVKAYLAHAAPFPFKRYLTDDRFAALKAAGMKVTLMHSTEDTGVPIENSKKMQAAYAEHGITATLIETKGGHYPAPETRVKIRQWVDGWR